MIFTLSDRVVGVNEYFKFLIYRTIITNHIYTYAHTCQQMSTYSAPAGFNDEKMLFIYFFYVHSFTLKNRILLSLQNVYTMRHRTRLEIIT